jgi:hypothetical protein
MDNKKKVIRQQTETVVDHETGEISKTTDLKESYIEQEPSYVKMYIQDIVRLNDLPSSAGKVLNILVSNMGYGNKVILIKPIKKYIMEQTGLSEGSVKRCIADLTKANILIRLERAVYLIDPSMFAKGKWADIKKLRMVIDYNEDGTKTINSNLVEQLKLNM